MNTDEFHALLHPIPELLRPMQPEPSLADPEVAVKTFASAPDKVRSATSSGSGYFSTVNRAVIPGFVVKEVPDPHRDGWVLWALHVMAMKEPPEWAPRIAALTLDREKYVLYALVEELQEFDAWSEGYKALPALQEDDPMEYEDTLYDRFGGGRFPGFVKAIREISEKLGDEEIILRLDLHRGNYMLRGETTVITDPLAVKDPATECWFRPDDEEAREATTRRFIEAAANDPRISVI